MKQRKFTIVSAKDRDGSGVSREQLDKDMPELQRQHNEASDKDATWDFFGGIIFIEGREYQVVPW